MIVVGWPMAGGVEGQFLGRKGGIGWLLRKNRIENGRRADPRGSNPHSYGESFSESGLIWASQKFSAVRVALRISERESMNVSMFIALLWACTRF